MVVLPRLIRNGVYSAYENDLEKQVKSNAIPNHIAIIMDGNRRFAKEVLKTDTEKGHIKGRDKLEEVVRWCADLGIKYLTVYAFSTENFNRDQKEVDYLLKVLEDSFYQYGDNPEVHENRVAIRAIGDRSLLPESLLKAIDYAESKTGSYDRLILNMAIAYGGRQDITNAVRQVALKVKEGELDVDDIDEDVIDSFISTSSIPDPDLVLRTSGEVRISNFLIWQIAYSELYFSDVYWPGFRRIDLLRAIRTYQMRTRRYGV